TPSWLTITALNPTNGKGPGTFSFAVAANNGAERIGTIIVNGITFTVTQSSGCTYTLSSSNFTAPVGGGNGSVNITANSGCAWTAQSSVSWITVSNTMGTGSGTVNFSVAPNTGPSRPGTINIGGQIFTVNQPSGCVYSLLPTSANPPSGGGTDIFSISAGAGCAWTAVSNDSWITVAAGSANGTGNATITFSIAANTGSSRTGTITAGGQTFTVNQPAGCTYSISPTSANPPASGSTGSVNVTVSNGCAWTAVSNASWITVTSGLNGNGNGTVQYTVTANTGLERIGTITIAGQTFTVTQANGCVLTLSPTIANPPSGGGTSSFNINSGANCTWSAVSNVSWITITSNTSGTGSGVINYTVAANIGPERTGMITVNGQTFTVNQANGCVYTLPSTSADVPSAGGTSSFNINAGAGCTWNAVSNDAWITVNTANGTGSGVINFTFAANIGQARAGTITVSGKTFTVNQASGCNYSISPTSANPPASGSTGSVNVTANTGCAWTAVSNAAWITVTSGSPGSGNGTVQYSVATNTGPERPGTITIAGQTFTVTQANGCVYTLPSTGTTAAAIGGAGNFSVNAGVGCTWTAVSNATWITVTSGSPGSGNGSVQYSVAANTGPDRIGTITVNGQTFTVTQANGCAFSINPSSQNFTAAAAGTGSFAITASNSTCIWTATTNAPTWITITNPTGTGNGTIAFSIAANTGPARSGTISVGGQTFTINQVSGCIFTLSSNGTNFPNSGGSGSFNVTTNNAGCSWTAVTTESWITINNGTGTGTGVVSFTVSANITPVRTGTITVGGQTFTITQDNGCVYTLSATGANPLAAGGTSSFNINAGAGCPWTAVSNVTWITVSNANGTGSGVINYTVAANIGPLRVGTITVGGKTFTVTQDSGCVFTLSSNSAISPASGLTESINVTAINGCTWTAVSNISWIIVTSGSPGSGNGTVQYTVAANTGPARTGTITIAGQTFTVNQANGCVYALSSTNISISESGGTANFEINSGAGCPWTAVSNVPWITI
ncbi:MAG: BACON domain-containing protein, partial [Pyrinomonadaceae bacterium]|nr:BACON domain-containing protein [Pyrinomonadaceae bacterium]